MYLQVPPTPGPPPRQPLDFSIQVLILHPLPPTKKKKKKDE